MRNPLIVAAIAFCLSAFCAANDLAPLNVKEGLWEVTVTSSMGGMPAMPALPPDVLAKLSPEQRAQVEARMKGGQSPSVTKQCITKEKLAKYTAFNANDRADCTHNVVSSTGRRLEMKMRCTMDKGGVADGTYVMEAISAESTKGTMHMVVNSGDHNMTMDMTVVSKYLGPACGDVK
ncbi:MAG: DUF3617 domain-containing protein [Terriglobales bacterium]